MAKEGLTPQTPNIMFSPPSPDDQTPIPVAVVMVVVVVVMMVVVVMVMVVMVPPSPICDGQYGYKYNYQTEPHLVCVCSSSLQCLPNSDLTALYLHLCEGQAKTGYLECGLLCAAYVLPINYTLKMTVYLVEICSSKSLDGQFSIYSCQVTTPHLAECLKFP